MLLCAFALQSACTDMGESNRPILTVTGCMEKHACNYNSEAKLDDPYNPCVFPEDNNYRCSDVCENDTDEDDVCDELEIAGCQDESACNYNPEATNAGECEGPKIFYVDVDGDGLGFAHPNDNVALPVSGDALPATVVACTPPPHYANNTDDENPNCQSNTLDECGVCDGDNSECADECGIPNGDNSSCADKCGVPNGDDSSCTGCSEAYIATLPDEEYQKLSICWHDDGYAVDPYTVPPELHEPSACLTRDCREQCLPVGDENRIESIEDGGREIYNDGIDNDCDDYTRGYYMIKGEAPDIDNKGRPILDQIGPEKIFQLAPFEGEAGESFEAFYFGEGFIEEETLINNKHCPKCEYPYHEENTITVLLYHEYDISGEGKMAYLALLAATNEDSPGKGLFQGTIEGADDTMDCEYIQHAANGACALDHEEPAHFRMKWGPGANKLRTGFGVNFFNKDSNGGCLTFKIDLRSPEKDTPQMKGVQKIRFIQYVPGEANLSSGGGLTISDHELRIDHDGDGISDGNVFSICTTS